VLPAVAGWLIVKSCRRVTSLWWLFLLKGAQAGDASGRILYQLTSSLYAKVVAVKKIWKNAIFLAIGFISGLSIATLNRSTALAEGLLAVESQAEGSQHDWPMWRYDAARSAASPQQLAEELHLQWVRELPAPSPAWPHQWDHRGKLDFDLSYSPVVLGDRIFVPSSTTDSVIAYSVEDGSELWRFYADGPVRLSPVAWNDFVYFISDDSYLYCVTADSGKLKWKFRGGPTEQKLLGNERIISFWAARGGPVIKDGLLYFAAGIWPLHGVFIYALDAESGEVVWVNDTTSSDYVELPHGGAEGYGGLAPQGYIAAGEDQLVVSAGRGPNPVHLDRRTGKVIQSDYRGKKGAGDYAVHAVGEGGMGMKTNEMLLDRIAALKDQIDGSVFYRLAARNRLFLTTENGSLYCFGPEKVQPIAHQYQPEPLSPRSGDWSETAQMLLDRLGESEGYVLMLGCGSGDLMRELLARSQMHVVVVEADAQRVRVIRDELVESGMYGRRAAVVEAKPSEFAVQPFLFSMVVSEDAQQAGFHSDESALANALHRLRPYGGVAWIGQTKMSQAALDEALQQVDADKVSAQVHADHISATRSGPLTGAGQWTHQHHDSANTLVSRERRAKLPLGLLWFGGPNNHDVLPRHSGGPRPHVVAGRQIYLGVDSIGARCVYTGRQLWRREFPGIGHSFTNLELEESWQGGEVVYMTNIPGATYIGSPFVSLADAIYLRYDGRIHKLDPETGHLVGSFGLPGRSVAELYGPGTPDWGHVSVQGDFLVTTGEPHMFEDQRMGWTESYSGTSSRLITVLDRHDGRVLWQREAGIGFRHNAIICSGETLFAIDGLSENALQQLARRGRDANIPSKVMALDLGTGSEIWTADSNVYGTFLIYSAEHDVLVEGGSQDLRRRLEDEPKNVTARRGSNGEILWELGQFLLPAAIHGDKLIPGRPGNAVSLLTGETWDREQPHTGATNPWTYGRRYGCNTFNASENLLLYRSGYASFFDLENDSGTGNFSGVRAGCTPNLIPADGLVNALDYTRSCACSYAQQTSMALIHMPGDTNIEFWTRYEAAPPNPTRHGINFGAPGRRVTDDGLVWYIAEGEHRRHASAIKEPGNSIAWVASSGREIESSDVIEISDIAPGEATIRLHFAELTASVKKGQRLFDVLINGHLVLNEFDIVAATGGCFRATVQEFQVNLQDRLVIELRKSQHSERGPLINGIEVLSKQQLAASGKP
jgi:outer membrane protein assembly factor BamB